MFGGSIKHPVQEITPTTLTIVALKTLKQADYLANKVLSETGTVNASTNAKPSFPNELFVYHYLFCFIVPSTSALVTFIAHNG